MKTYEKVWLIIYCIFIVFLLIYFSFNFGMAVVQSGSRVYTVTKITTKIVNGDTVKCDTMHSYVKWDNPILNDTLLNPKKPKP